MSFSVSASGMAAQRVRMNVIANNLANTNTTRTPEGGPYRRREVLLEAIKSDGGFAKMLSGKLDSRGGVRVTRIVEDLTERAFVIKKDDTHPDADENGFVKVPNIDPVVEMVHLLSATRAFEANVTAFNSTKQIFRKALEIGSG